MTSLDILFYSLTTAVLLLVAIFAYIAYYIVGVLKSAQRLVDKSVETVNSVQDLKNKLNSEFIKGAAMSGLGFLGKSILKKITRSRK